MSQRKYAPDIITEIGLLGAKPPKSPMEQNHKVALASGHLLVNSEQYSRLIGRLIYLGIIQQPREQHWEAALQVVRYIKKNPGQRIVLRADSD